MKNVQFRRRVFVFYARDNVENSADSRVFGMVHRRQILGEMKVILLNLKLEQRIFINSNNR